MTNDIKFREITEDQFFEEFMPVPNTIVSDANYDGCMFETFGKELEYVLSVAKERPNHVWTVLDCGDDGWCIGSGYHLVNRLGYLITANPCPDGEEILVPDDCLDIYERDEEEEDDDPDREQFKGWNKTTFRASDYM